VAENDRRAATPPPEICRSAPRSTLASDWHGALLSTTVGIPEMSRHRVQATIVRKRVAKAVVETVLVLALLVPWALIFGWLFGRDIFR
jgi:hypothetical protein